MTAATTTAVFGADDTNPSFADGPADELPAARTDQTVMASAK